MHACHKLSLPPSFLEIIYVLGQKGEMGLGFIRGMHRVPIPLDGLSCYV